ncbi:hypothetical protein BKA69DRAFT_1053520 [Paraphysoderma sedebokerense]|nr:hypothetical protein BKA69DRAFT_1053520 [Paraphysoderma sedebokerense]
MSIKILEELLHSAISFSKDPFLLGLLDDETDNVTASNAPFDIFHTILNRESVPDNLYGSSIRLMKPYYKTIAHSIHQWHRTNIYPFNRPPIDLLSNLASYELRKPILLGNIQSLFSSSTALEELTLTAVNNFVSNLNQEDVYLLLGLSQTIGTVFRIPPSFRQCIYSFNQLHNSSLPYTPESSSDLHTSSSSEPLSTKKRYKPSLLTVGARALTKHANRANWWGEITGKESMKNQQANIVLSRILEDIAWVNVHSLPPGNDSGWKNAESIDRSVESSHPEDDGRLKENNKDRLATVEMRNSSGYGARWVFAHGHSEALNFRGFLEPQMEDGHDKRWRH